MEKAESRRKKRRRKEGARLPRQDEVPEELLEHVVGGLAPEAALARFEYFRRISEQDK